MRSPSKKIRGPSLVVIVIGLIVWGIILWFHPSTSKDFPRSVPSDSNSLIPSTSVPVPTVQGSKPKRESHENTSPIVSIFVVDTGISPKWGLKNAIAGWKKAKWTDIYLVNVCPVAKPCVTVSEKKLAVDEAGQTNFGYREDTTTLYLNKTMPLRSFEAQSVMSHEFGHVLGAPHIVGTNNTVMTALDGFYRALPTALDLQVVDSLGRWDLEKMYEESGKTLDVRAQPK